jgi:ABC-type transport system substrate-binding protein
MVSILRRATATVCLLAACCAASGAFAAADPNKVLRISWPTSETGFDPVKVSDLYSNEINEVIFDRLLTYDYLARPAKLVPQAAEAMPEITDGGRTYTFKIKRGIYFTPDPAFHGRKRELTAEDFVYSFKRFADPKNRAPYGNMVEDIEGLTEWAKRGDKAGEMDYGAVVPGLVALDKYTLRIKLNKPSYVFLYTCAHAPFGAVAREVIETYADTTEAHPVGTGPYMLKEWTRASKVVLVANPDFRQETWDFTASEPGWDDAVIRDMKGKSIPQIGRIEISVMEEEQSRWLAFQQKELDLLAVPGTFRPQALGPDGKILPVLGKKGLTLYKTIDPDLTYVMLNTRDPVIGGFTNEKIALRRAIIMGYNVDDDITVIRRGQAVKANMPIPYGVVGYDPRYRTINPYDPILANKLLDHYGYKKGADGYRTMPDGKPLVLRYASESSEIYRQYAELWKKNMDAIGLRIEFDIGKFPDHLKQAKACQLMMWGAAWTADYPDGENFLQLLYGPNVGQINYSCYESKAYDAFFDKARSMPDSPERNHLYLEMTRQMEVDGAWSMNVSRERDELIQPGVRGYKKHPILQAEFVYMDIDPKS